LGLEKIHRLTKSENVTLRIDMEDFNGVLVYAEYDLFLVGDVSENFILTVGSFEGICLQC
jgi:ficolin